MPAVRQPNLLFVFADQWRRQALGHEGDPNVKTPRLDDFAAEGVRFANAVSGCPVCGPYRASLLTGQYPLTHGMVVNDQPIRSEAVSFADALNSAGYHTAYIGKWHIDGHGRSSFVSHERRLGFQHWLGYECSHQYVDSPYYADTPEPRIWKGYDAEAQTTAAVEYVREHAATAVPFALFLSWGPPHDPYDTAPERFRRQYRPEETQLRPNVPVECANKAQELLAGYYAHCSALDECFGRLLDELRRLGLDNDTIVIFTSDHGDMLGSHGLWKKQWPHEESISVPFLLRWPGGLSEAPRTVTQIIDAPDIMPTILGLCGAPVPATVEGRNLSGIISGEEPEDDAGALLSCYFPFHELHYRNGGRDFRGIRTRRHTYVRDHDGPWLLFDNQADPWQLRNVVTDPASADVLGKLDAALAGHLRRRGDRFETGVELLRRYTVRLIATDHGDDVYYET